MKGVCVFSFFFLSFFFDRLLLLHPFLFFTSFFYFLFLFLFPVFPLSLRFLLPKW